MTGREGDRDPDARRLGLELNHGMTSGHLNPEQHWSIVEED